MRLVRTSQVITTSARQMKTMLSDMRLSRILHRIQFATHAKSSCHTNVICDVFTPDLPRDSSEWQSFWPAVLPTKPSDESGPDGRFTTDICSLPAWPLTQICVQICATTGQRNLLHHEKDLSPSVSAHPSSNFSLVRR